MTRSALTFAIAVVLILLVESSAPARAGVDDPASRIGAELDSKIEAAMAEWLARHPVRLPERLPLALSPPASLSIQLSTIPATSIPLELPVDAVGHQATEMVCQLPLRSDVLQCRIVPVSDRIPRPR